MKEGGTHVRGERCRGKGRAPLCLFPVLQKRGRGEGGKSRRDEWWGAKVRRAGGGERRGVVGRPRMRRGSASTRRLGNTW